MGQTEVNAEIIASSDHAIMVDHDGTEFWIPRKLCFDGHSLDVGDTLKMVPTWWYEANVK